MAYGLTWLQIINRVLVRLRESTVAANNTTAYSTQIGQVVNQVKTEIEQAFYWNALRDTFEVTTVDGTATYVLEDSGQHAIVLSGWNTTNGYEILRGTNREFDKRFFGATSTQSGAPTRYMPAGVDLNYDVRLDLHPVPDAAYVLKFNVYVPQAELAADGDIPLVPQNVLIEETISRMLRERGELGENVPPTGFIQADLLAQAVAIEHGRDDSELQWTVE